MNDKTDDVLEVLAVGILLFSVEGLGLLLTVLLAILFAGQVIGENNTLLTIYVIGAMSFSYLIPALLVLTFRLRNIGQAALVLIIASIVFAIPSSFVAESGCKAGNEQAMWAMRVIPIWWLGDTLMTPDDGNLTCHSWERRP